MIRLAFRIWIDGRKELEETTAVAAEAWDELLPRLGAKHAAFIAGRNHMIEIEFLDEPDQSRRYLRFGTDPCGMVMPVKIQ
jgi:hypothetical protein